MTSNPIDTQAATVVHVLNGLAFGGIENLCLQLLLHSPPKVRNILINLEPEHLEMLPLFEQVPNLVILEQPYRANQRVQFVWSLMVTLSKLQPQAVLIYPFGIHIFVGLAARLAQVPSIVVHVGNTVPTQQLMRNKWNLIVIASRLLRIPLCFCSTAVQKSFQELTKLPQGSCSIPNGCDVEAIAARARMSRENQPANSVKVIGMVARLNKIKDHETLIRAFGIVHSKFPKTQLWLVGDGEEKDSLQNLTNQLKLQPAVTFWGNRADIPELLGQMDIYAFSTTENEGFGIALTEAMAAGLPIVASDVSACREVLGNGEAGVLIPQKDSTVLAQTLQKLLFFPEERDYWGQKSYQYAVTYHSIQQCYRQWHSVLSDSQDLGE